MALYVFYTSNGVLNSWSPNDSDPVAPPAELATKGLDKKTGLPPLGPTVAWDEATRTTVTVTAPTPSNALQTWDFINAFTANELAAIRGTTSDNNIQQFLFSLQCTQGVNLNATTINNSLQYLVNKGLLTAPRKQEILATTSSGTAGGGR
jgi:hypothetical protein